VKGKLTHEAIYDALREGRVVFGYGPLLIFSIDKEKAGREEDVEIGDEVNISWPKIPLKIKWRDTWADIRMVPPKLEEIIIARGIGLSGLLIKIQKLLGTYIDIFRSDQSGALKRIPIGGIEGSISEVIENVDTIQYLRLELRKKILCLRVVLGKLVPFGIIEPAVTFTNPIWINKVPMVEEVIVLQDDDVKYQAQWEWNKEKQEMRKVVKKDEPVTAASFITFKIVFSQSKEKMDVGAISVKFHPTGEAEPIEVFPERWEKTRKEKVSFEL
jgi:hypothetical protein